MGKRFFDVFPSLKAEQNIRNLFEEVEVTKVSTTSSKDCLRIYLLSTHLIRKSRVFEMERMIKEQLFGSMQIDIHIFESFMLSRQYTPENLMREYRDSILDELKGRSMVEYNMFLNTKYRFEEGNTLCLTMEDSVIAQGKQEAIASLIQKVFNERCNVPIHVRVIYEEAKESKYKKYNELQLQQEINAIVDGNMARHKEHVQEIKEAREEKKEQKEAAKEAGKPAAKFEKKTFQKSEFKKREYQPVKRSDDPTVVYGRAFEDEPIELSQVVGEMGEITIRGKVISFETREIRNEKSIIMFAVTDFTDTIMVKMFTRNEQLPEILSEVKEGAFLKIKGVTTIDKFDGELTIGSVTGIKKIPNFVTTRMDTSPVKRVELHCHTKMSDMDGVSEVKDIVRRAHDWGHKAIAITDHGVVQSFPDANHYIETLDKDDPFKVIYGVEGYLVDDMTDIAVGAGDETLDDTYVVFDIETTGFSSVRDRIIEIGAVKVEHGKIVERYSTFVNPQIPIPFEITKLTSITDAMVMDAPAIEKVLPEFMEFVGDASLVAHNAGFDVGFIEANLKRQNMERKLVSVDTVALARVLLPTLSRYKLNVVAKTLGISLKNHHRAVDDAAATAEIFVKFVEMLKERGITTLKDVNEFGATNPDAVKKMTSYHVIILAKNDLGRVNLYTLISMSHLKYFSRVPRIPKSELMKYREGLIWKCL